MTVRYGLLHNHTENSVRDSVMSVTRLVDRAKELGAPAVALTDHGSMTGYIDFYRACVDNEIKPIIGVEAYVEENSEGRRHLILLAKDLTGFNAISKAVTASNERVSEVGKLSFPRMNREILEKQFGKDAPGHGHVIATSACVSGILAGLMFKNDAIAKKTESLRKKQQGLEDPQNESFLKNASRLEELLRISKDLTQEVAALKKQATKSLLSLEKKAANDKDPEKQKEARRQLLEEQTLKAQAEKALAEKKLEKEATDKEIKTLRPIVSQQRTSASRYVAIQEKIDEILKEKLSDDEIHQAMVSEAKYYRELFGEDFYIELQYHGMRQEKKVMPILAQLAHDLEIPVVLANDAHIPTNAGDDVLARTVIRTTMFDSWEDATAADRELYLKSDEELITKVSEILDPETVKEGFENIRKIVDSCSIFFEKQSHNPAFSVPGGKTAAEHLTQMAYAGIQDRYGSGWTKAHEERLRHELDVITSMGYADYHLIVQDFLRFARAAGKLHLDDPEEARLLKTYDTERIEAHVMGRSGECVGPGRGSAAGSIVCYLIGITNIDPIRYGLLFERFLNPERVSMPDIDCDISKTFRPYVIEYVKKKYGEEAVCGIMTKGTLSGKAAVKTAARVYGLQKKNDSTYYYGVGEELARKIVDLSDDELHIDLEKISDDIEDIFKDHAVALEIYRYAKLVEGSCNQIGQHASGIIISDGRPISDYVPLIYNAKTDIMMSQCDMVQAEDFCGLLKMDFLGLKNMTVISNTLRLIQEGRGQYVDIDHLPFETEVFKDIFSAAQTDSVFQFESPGMKQMLANFRPDSIDDLILLVAAYRPGPLQYLDGIIAVKQGARDLTYLTPELEPILGKTYGSIIYQEQVQEIFKSLAGYSLGQADLVRRAMAKKKEKVLLAERTAFVHGDPERNIRGCVASGISEEVANRLFDQMTDFAKYAFNKSHAACYAVVAYQTAYLKYHYPAEYMCSVLNVVESEKYSGLISDIRNLRTKILPPCVNESELGFSLKDGAIRFGLGMIKGLGDSISFIVEERKRNGRFVSLNDFLIRCMPGEGLLKALAGAGAFDCFCSNRTAIKELIPDYLDALKKIKSAGEKLNGACFGNEKLRERYAESLSVLDRLMPDARICEDMMAVLSEEKELLCAYVSRHPLELYGNPSDYHARKISDVTGTAARTVSVMGMISEKAEKARKRDGAKMCFFTLSDKTGDIPVSCFAESYERYGKDIEDGKVVLVTGNLMTDGDTVKLSVSSLKPLIATRQVIVVYVKDIADWMENVKEKVEVYSSGNGNPVKVYDLFLDELRNTDLVVSPSICESGAVNCTLSEMKV